jgi:hypothetical protein
MLERLRSIKNVIEAKFYLWAASYIYLLGDQILAILKIIDAEVIRSFHFGLRLSHDDLFKEKIVTLSILNKMNGLLYIRVNMEFEDARRFFSELLCALLEKELRFYFEEADKASKTRNMYNCHLESVATAIMQAIYNRKILYT